MFKNLQNDPQVHQDSVQAGREMCAYLAGELQRRRQEESGAGRHDVFARLVRTRFAEDIPFDDKRIVANMAGLLIGGVETVSQAIVQVLAKILSDPKILASATEAARAEDPAQFDAIVWEALRFDPINVLVFRLSNVEATVAAGMPWETVLPQETIVFACTASAMFDEAELPDPQAFRPGRPPHHYLHFGYGHHRCLGRNLGSVEIPEVVRRVLLRPGVHLLAGDAGAVDFQGGPFPERFVIGFDPAGSPRAPS